MINSVYNDHNKRNYIRSYAVPSLYIAAADQ